MALLTATNGNVTVAAGSLGTVPDGPWTFACVFRRDGTTTDGYENLGALETSGGQIITNVGADAAAEPYAVQCGQGGATRTFAGLDDLADGDAYVLVVIKDNGTVDPEANLYRLDAGSPAWHGWVTGTGGGDFENRSDTISRGRLLNQQGGFPWNGGIWAQAWWNVKLAKADITDGSNGLHVGVQKWLDINGGTGLVALWRPGETDPVADESPSGTSDETASSGVTITAGDPTGFDMDFSAGGATGTFAADLPALDGTLTGVSTATGTATADLPALDGTLAGTGTATGALAADLPALDGQLAGVSTAAGTFAGDLPALDGALAGAGTATGVLAADLPALDGQLAGAGTASGVPAGDLPGLAGELTGTSDTPPEDVLGTLDGDLPALDGALAGAGSATGTFAGDLPELIGPLLGVREGGVSRPLRALKTTTVDIYMPVTNPDEWSGDTGGYTLDVTGVPASVIEQDRVVNDPRTGTARVVRRVTGRVPDGTSIETTSKVVDAENRTYAVSSVRQVRNPLWTGDIVLELVRTDQLAT
jgi:hypothetical protein